MSDLLDIDFQGLVEQVEQSEDESEDTYQIMAVAKSTNIAPHKCKWADCNFSSDNMLLLLTHTQGHVGFKRNGTFKPSCEWEGCHFNKNSRAKIKEHITSHFSCRPHQCNQCTCSFKNPRHLSKHVKTKHSEVEQPVVNDMQAEGIINQEFGGKVIVNQNVGGTRLKRTNAKPKPYFKPYFLPDVVPISYLSQIYEYPNDQYFVQNNIPPPVYHDFSSMIRVTGQTSVTNAEDLDMESDLYSILFSD